MPTPGKLGKLAAVRPHGLGTLATYALGKLPAPPASVDYGLHVANWGMLANDVYGDCTMAGAAHLLRAWDSEVAEDDPVPTAQEVVDEYFTLTDGQDSGLNEHDVLSTWRSIGLWGDRIAGYAPVETSDLTALHQAIAFYGGAYLGVALPKSAQTQFAHGEEWTVVPGSPIEGGHCIVAVGYDAHSVRVVTWGAEVSVSYPWLAAYLDEAWCVLSHQFLEAGHGPTLDLASLQEDLDAV